MSALVLDAGALVAVDRGDREVMARIRAAHRLRTQLRTSAIVIAEVWRDARGRQAELARLLRSVDVRPVDQAMAREAGALIGRAGSDDPIDATVVLVANHGDRILTSDSRDIRRLADVAGRYVVVIPC